MIGAKHFDPILGVDIHIALVPAVPAPIPTPLPNPFIGMVLDPMDYIPFIGATVYINGMPRAQAGTAGVALPPHLPIVGPLVPPPANEAEIFMGSATVASDGDAQSRLGMMVLSCQTIGMPSPPRPKGVPAKSLVLPTSVVLSIPMGMLVLVGGPPTISLMALGMRAAFALAGLLGKALRKAQRGAGKFGDLMRAITAKARKAGDELADFLKLGQKGRARVNKAICTVTGHPVDVATGKVFTDKIDLELPGAIPFKWERTWYSTSTYKGPLGHGWHHEYDAGLYVNDQVVLYRTPDGRLISFPPLKEGEEHFDRTERLTISRSPGKYDGEYSIRTISRLTYRFRELRENKRAPLSAPRDPRTPVEHVLTRIFDDVGNNLSFEYDERGQLSEIIDCGGRSLQLITDKHGRITQLTAPHPDEADKRFVVMQYAYDRDGNLVQTIDALGQPATYGYDRHLLAKETNRNGLSFYFQYDAKDETAKCLRTWGDGGIYDHKLTYDSEQNLTVVENSLGYRTQYFHDGGLVTKTIDARGGVIETEYNEHNQKVKEADQVGGVTTWSYDERGNTTEVVGPDGAKLAIEYTNDKPARATDAIGGTWTWTYDERGRLTERINPIGAKMRFQYQGARLGAMVDALDHVTGLSYDERGALSGVHTPDGGSSSWQYDGLGRATVSTDASGNSQRRRFDLCGRVVKVDEPDGNIRELAFDREGNVTRVRDAHHDVRFAYQGMNRLASRSEAGTSVRFEYDAEERLVGIINEHGHAYSFALGPTGEIDAESGFDGVRRVYERDAAGRARRVQRANGIESNYGYDKGGRITKAVHLRKTRVAGQEPAALVEEQLGAEQFTYRKNGDLIGAQNESTTLTFERDALGRIVKETQGKHTVSSEYDALGLRKQMQSSLGAELKIERNAMGDVEHVQSRGGFEARHQRDLLGLELERELPGGVRSHWKRDKLGRPLQHEISTNDTLLRARSYQWDKADRLRVIIDALQGPVHYTHDALGNLAAATYSDGTVNLRMPDAVGNLFKTNERKDRKYGPAGQLLESTDARGRVTRYAYDAEGNLIEKREGSGRTWRYRWGADGMMSEVERPDGTIVRFAYDPLGRRVAKHYRGLTTRWVWDGNVPLHEWVEGQLERASEPNVVPMWAADPEITKREAELSEHLTRGPPQAGSKQQPITWLFEPESFAPMAKLGAAGTHSIICDHLGTPLAMVDGAGTKVWSTDVSVYGELRGLEGDRFACPFRWPGQYEDAETGLYYNRFRYYDPDATQYTSRDPLGIDAGRHLYAYSNDPTSLADPFGLTTCRGPDAASQLPPMKGMSVGEAEDLLRSKGFAQTKVSNSPGKNQTWNHPDGSEVRIHPYGNEKVTNKAGDLTPKSGLNAHVHKETPGGAQLTDRGIPSTNLDETHIGIKNPSDLPAVRQRPHGHGA